MGKPKLKQLIAYFITYSFLGWIIDTSYRSLLAGNFAPGAVTSLPFTPIYGFGALILIVLHQQLKDMSVLATFFFYGLLLTTLEYLGGLFCLYFLETRLWDYSGTTLNIQGHVNALHSFYWGLLAVLFIKLIHPFFVSKFSKSSK